VLGREDDRDAEIVFGLSAGETIAVRNTFTLKAELGKAEAEHHH
jgi:membrane fusion protein, heavy metal efflux system